MAVRVDETGQQELGVVTDHSSLRIFRGNRDKWPGLDDRAASDRDGPAGNYARVA